MRRWLRSQFERAAWTALILGFALAAAIPGGAQADEPLRLLLSPRGDDAHDGLSLDTPILSIARAQEILYERLPEGGRDVELRIAPGTYYNQHVVWTFTMPDHSIRFMPLFDDGNHPRFDGGDSGETWFVLRHSEGQATNLVFQDLHVRNYWMGISLEGKREVPETSNSFNRIEGCIFERIGNLSAPDRKPSYAAVRFINSDYNLVANCHFIDIINTRDCGLLHALYLAHYSHHNLILRNRIENNCGDPIRVRDFSNENVIRENHIIRSGVTAAYTEWYCDHDRLDSCTKQNPECPSWGNRFIDNILSGDKDGHELRVSRLFFGESTSGCERPAGATQRVITDSDF
jgi:hypothetical protein